MNSFLTRLTTSIVLTAFVLPLFSSTKALPLPSVSLALWTSEAMALPAIEGIDAEADSELDSPRVKFEHQFLHFVRTQQGHREPLLRSAISLMLSQDRTPPVTNHRYFTIFERDYPHLARRLHKTVVTVTSSLTPYDEKIIACIRNECVYFSPKQYERFFNLSQEAMIQFWRYVPTLRSNLKQNERFFPINLLKLEFALHVPNSSPMNDVSPHDMTSQPNKNLSDDFDRMAFKSAERLLRQGVRELLERNHHAEYIARYVNVTAAYIRLLNSGKRRPPPDRISNVWHGVVEYARRFYFPEGSDPFFVLKEILDMGYPAAPIAEAIGMSDKFLKQRAFGIRQMNDYDVPLIKQALENLGFIARSKATDPMRRSRSTGLAQSA